MKMHSKVFDFRMRVLMNLTSRHVSESSVNMNSDREFYGIST